MEDNKNRIPQSKSKSLVPAESKPFTEAFRLVYFSSTYNYCRSAINYFYSSIAFSSPSLLNPKSGKHKEPRNSVPEEGLEW